MTRLHRLQAPSQELLSCLRPLEMIFPASRWGLTRLPMLSGIPRTQEDKLQMATLSQRNCEHSRDLTDCQHLFTLGDIPMLLACATRKAQVDML